MPGGWGGGGAGSRVGVEVFNETDQKQMFPFLFIIRIEIFFGFIRNLKALIRFTPQMVQCG